MIPSITNVRNWTPAVLHDRALAVDGLTCVLGGARDEYATTASTLWQSWVGRAAEAAEDHLDREHRHFRAIAEELIAVSDQLRRADTALTFAVLSARNAIANAERNGFTVDDSGITAGPDTGAPETAIEHVEAIRAAMQTVGELDDHYARALTEIVTNLLEIIPKGAVLSPGEAAHDWASLTDGTLDADEIGRLLSNLTAAGLDGNALAALAAGNEISMLPAGSIRYLEEFYRQGGTDGFLALQHALEQDGSPRAVAAGQALASGILILSNENVVDADGQRGGWDRLPADVRDLVRLNPQTPPPATLSEFLDSRSPFERERLEGTAGAAAAAHAAMLNDPGDDYAQRVGLQNDFWRYVAAADGVPGTQLATELVRAAATQVELVAADPPERTVVSDAAYRFPGDVGESLLDVATRNNEANARILTDDFDGDGTPDSRRDTVLDPLFAHEWHDEGASLGRLTSWMTDDALAAHATGDTGSPDFDRRDRADRAALGLATYLSDPDHYERFMDMHGPDSSNLGEVNPELLHAASRGLVGYIPHLAGIDTDSSEWGTRALESSDAGDKRFVHAQRVFSLMATGQDANTTFMGGALAFQESYDHVFVRSLVEPDKWGMISPDTAAAGNSAHIQALIDTGIYGAALEQSRDQENIANFVAERRNQAYDVGYTMMRNAVASFLPANFTVGMGMDMFNPTVRDIFTIPEAPTENYAFTVNESMLDSHNDMRMMRYLIEEVGTPRHPAAVQHLTLIGLLDENAMLAHNADAQAQHDAQTIRARISSAMIAEYGTNLLERYNDEYRLSYVDVAPATHLGADR